MGAQGSIIRDPPSIFSHLLTEAWVKADNPAGMLPKILSGGLLKLFRVGLTFLINSIGHVLLGLFF